MCKRTNKQIIKFEQNLCNARIDDNGVLYVRVNSIVHSKNAIIEVPFSHEAVVIKGGGDTRYYKSGNYNVFESKEEIKQWKNGLSLEIIYMPKEAMTLIQWGTYGITYRDNKSQRIIKIGASGSFVLTIDNSEMFFRKVVGTSPEFNKQVFNDRFSDIISNEFADIFLGVVEEEKIEYALFDARKKQIGGIIESILDKKFRDRYGLSVQDFVISNIRCEGTEEIEKERLLDIDIERKSDPKYHAYQQSYEREKELEWEKEKFKIQIGLVDSLAKYRLEADLAAINAQKTGQQSYDGDTGVSIYGQCINGVIEFTCIGENGQSAGSGFLIGQNGLAITNTHVVTEDNVPCKKIIAQIANEKVEAQILALGDDKGGRGDGVDLALVLLERVPQNAFVLDFEDFKNVKTGEEVFVIGNSLDDGSCITRGIVSDRLRGIARDESKKYLMTDCAINPGNSGGPIFNRKGNVIGVMVASRLKDGADAKGMNYAIPADVTQAFIGFTVKQISGGER